MKKLIYSILSVSVLLFASCSEDRGTTTEVTDADKDNIKQSNIREYGQEGATGAGTTDADYVGRTKQITDRMASDLQLDQTTQERVTAVIYDRERRLGELEGRYNVSDMNRMGGEPGNDTKSDKSNNTNTTQDPIRSNNAGNAYEGNDLNNETGRNLKANQTAMATEYNKIIADSDKELKAILTPEQYSKFDKNRNNYTTVTTNTDNATGTTPEGDNMNNPTGNQR